MLFQQPRLLGYLTRVSFQWLDRCCFSKRSCGTSRRCDTPVSLRNSQPSHGQLPCLPLVPSIVLLQNARSLTPQCKQSAAFPWVRTPDTPVIPAACNSEPPRATCHTVTAPLPATCTVYPYPGGGVSVLLHTVTPYPGGVSKYPSYLSTRYVGNRYLLHTLVHRYPGGCISVAMLPTHLMSME